MSFKCIGINGFSGDRTPEAMLECHDFAKSFAAHFDLPYELAGEPESAQDLPWHLAIIESKVTFERVIKHLKKNLDAGFSPILVTPRCATRYSREASKCRCSLL